MRDKFEFLRQLIAWFAQQLSNPAEWKTRCLAILSAAEADEDRMARLWSGYLGFPHWVLVNDPSGPLVSFITARKISDHVSLIAQLYSHGGVGQGRWHEVANIARGNSQRVKDSAKRAKRTLEREQARLGRNTADLQEAEGVAFSTTDAQLAVMVQYSTEAAEYFAWAGMALSTEPIKLTAAVSSTINAILTAVSVLIIEECCHATMVMSDVLSGVTSSLPAVEGLEARARAQAFSRYATQFLALLEEVS